MYIKFADALTDVADFTTINEFIRKKKCMNCLNINKTTMLVGKENREDANKTKYWNS